MKLQSAMEYLMTYGWAILIIAVVLGALFGLGVFNGAAVLGSGCVAQPGYLCQQPRLSANGTLFVNIGQVGQQQITITSLGCSNTAAEPASFAGIKPSLTLLNSQVAQGTSFSCPLVSNTLGSSFTGTLWIQYTTSEYPGVTIPAEIGTISTKVSQTGVPALPSGGSTSLSSSSSTSLSSSSSTTILCRGFNAWVSDTRDDQATELSCSGTLINAFAVGNFPQGLALDPSGDVWVTDRFSNAVTELSSSGSLIGTYPVGSDPLDVAIAPGGGVWVTNYGGASVTELSSSGSTLGTFSTGSGPTDVAIATDGTVWVTDQSSGQITELSSTGNLIATYSPGGAPAGIAIDSSGDVWFTNAYSTSVEEIIPGVRGIGTFDTDISGVFGIAIDQNGNIWVSGDDAVSELSPTGNVIGTYSVTTGPYAISVDPDDNIWVAYDSGAQVTALSDTGNILGTFTVGNAPYGVASEYLAPAGPAYTAPGVMLSPSATAVSSGNTLVLTGTITGGVAPYALQWTGSVEGGNLVTSDSDCATSVPTPTSYTCTITAPTVANPTSDTYTITVTDGADNVASNSVQVTIDPPITLLASGQGQPAGITTDGTNIYWVDYGSGDVESFPIGGVYGDASTLADNQQDPLFITSDGTNVYWTTTLGGPSSTGTLQEESVSGPLDSNTLLASDLAEPEDVVVNSGTVYWTDLAGGDVNSISTSGGPTTTLTSQPDPDILQLYSGDLYFTTPNAGYGLYSIPDTGGAPTQLNTGFGLVGPNWLTVYNNVVYFTVGNGGNNGAIQTVPTTGGVPSTIVSGLNDPEVLATDGTNLYWIDGHDIYMAPIAGGTPTVLVSTSTLPYSLIVYRGELYWTDLTSGGVYEVNT